MIMIGEIRNEQSFDMAVKSAFAGHLVFSTLHTNDTVSAISRMLDMKAESFICLLQPLRSSSLKDLCERSVSIVKKKSILNLKA